jgi:hypothetical protein
MDGTVTPRTSAVATVGSERVMKLFVCARRGGGGSVEVGEGDDPGDEGGDGVAVVGQTGLPDRRL